MEGRADTGVKGFFEEYGKAGSALRTAPLQVEKPNVSPANEVGNTSKEPKSKSEKVRARVGRPPGITNGSRSQKEKATMHVNAALLDYYRDWSWEARCNLGELIERAMVAYKDKRNRTSGKKSRQA
jgi:hypothetical protein